MNDLSEKIRINFLARVGICKLKIKYTNIKEYIRLF